MLFLAAVTVALSEASTQSQPMPNQKATPVASQVADSAVSNAELQYRVAFLEDEETLKVRVAPGEQAEIVDTLVNGEPVQPLNAGQTSGGIQWIQVRYHEDKTGWLDRNYLAATLNRDTFCDDPRPRKLIAVLQEAVKQRDSQKFARSIVPRGLYLGLDGDKTLFLSPSEVLAFFTDESLRDWGSTGNPGKMVQGTLADSVTQLLQRNLIPEAGTVQIACNDNQDSLSSRERLWNIRIPGVNVPEESDNNAYSFYSVLRPGTPGHELDWGAWGLMIEYWNGYPVLTGLSYYRWKP
jgi:hypothetical protein